MLRHVSDQPTNSAFGKSRISQDRAQAIRPGLNSRRHIRIGTQVGLTGEAPVRDCNSIDAVSEPALAQSTLSAVLCSSRRRRIIAERVSAHVSCSAIATR